MIPLKTKLDKIWNRPGVSDPLRKALWKVVNGKYCYEVIPHSVARRIKRKLK